MANEKELKLHDGTALFIPSGWTVEIEKTLESSAASLSDGTGYAKVTPTIIARLIPASENALEEIKYMHDRECRRQKDEGVLCQDNCYFKTSGLKECPVKSGIVATGIAEAGQPEALAFLNEDDWTVPESGAPTYAARLACTRWLSQCLEFGWRKDQLDGLEKIWWQHHDRNGVLVKPDKAVSPPSQAERDSQEELWKEAINIYSKRDHSAVTSTDIEESMEQSRDVRIRADSPRTYETGYLDGYVDGVMVTQDLEPVPPPSQAESESQEEMIREIVGNFKEAYENGESIQSCMDAELEKFTITRKKP